MSGNELKNRVRDELKMFIANSNNGRGDKLTYFCGGRNSSRRIEMCLNSYATLHERKKTYIYDIIQELKCGVVVSKRPLNKHTKVSTETYNSLQQKAQAYGFTATKEDIALVLLTNKPEILNCVAWMKAHFELCGDCQPNRNNEIHLEPITKSTIHSEYKYDCEHYPVPEPFVSPSVFYLLWLSQFSHIKIRKFKACGGKCNACAVLSDGRQRDASNLGRQEYTQLHAYHRMTYMSERKLYYERRFESISMPAKVYSSISDGMAQLHNELPHRAGLSNFPTKLKCHLQGYLAHGRHFHIYRTYNNIGHDSNLAVHIWLLELELELNKNKGHLQDTTYYQMDGGPENNNRITLAICELLVAKGLTKKLVLTRLPPGHTHEDIDALFGVIWTRFRNCHVRSPQEAARLFKEAFAKRSIKDKSPVKIVDIFAVPDYWYYLLDCIDPDFGRVFKEEHTRLQWIFERVTPCARFPLGVRTTFRTYASDKVWEIWDKSSIQLKDGVSFNSITSFVPVELSVTVEPAPSPENPTGGFSILKRLPSGNIGVLPFIKGSRAELDKTIADAKRIYLTESDSTAADDWETFGRDHFPASDDAEEYCRSREVPIPLWNKLFEQSDLSLPTEETNQLPELNIYAPNSAGIFKARTVDSASYAGHKTTAAAAQPRELLPDPRLQTTEVLPPQTRRMRTEAAFLRNYSAKRLQALAEAARKAAEKKKAADEKKRAAAAVANGNNSLAENGGEAEAATAVAAAPIIAANGDRDYGGGGRIGVGGGRGRGRRGGRMNANTINNPDLPVRPHPIAADTVDPAQPPTERTDDGGGRIGVGRGRGRGRRGGRMNANTINNPDLPVGPHPIAADTVDSAQPPLC